jgi:multisubunit Na+/H+ antiporter MnhC subunit
MIVVRIVAGMLLLAHGLVHLLYLAPDVKEFSIDRSSLLPEPARRPVAMALILATVVAFALAALAVWGVPGLAGAWPTLMIMACLLSVVLLVTYWDSALAIGIAIDLALAAVAVTRPDWADRLVG